MDSEMGSAGRRNFLTKNIRTICIVALVFLMVVLLVQFAATKENTSESSTDSSPQVLEDLYGRAAPEFRSIQQWKNSRPLKIADLRGRYVLLDFWGYWCAPCVRDMPHLMAIAEAFSDTDLAVVAIHDASVTSVEEMDEKLDKTKENIWMGRNIEFPIAIDAKEHPSTKFEDPIDHGATTSAYCITKFPTTLLIGPDGKVIEEFHAPSLDEKIAYLEDLIGVDAKDPPWRKEFDKVYHLEPDKVLCHIPAPFIPQRDDFFFLQYARWGWFYFAWHNRPMYSPQSAVLKWNQDSRKAESYMDHEQMRLIDLLRHLGFYEREFEGDPTLLEQDIAGDWILRENVNREELLGAFAEVLNDQLRLPVRFTPKQAQRTAIVATGTLNLHLPEECDKQEIALFTHHPDPPDNISGGGGSGAVSDLLDYIGRLANVEVIDRTDPSGAGRIVWRQHSTARTNMLRSNPELLNVLLKNVTEQTSLHFKTESVERRVWQVARP